MPVYRIMIREVHAQTVEEIYHAIQDAYYDRVVEIEAEDEDAARDMALDGEGTLITEDWDYGDIGDSEYHCQGDVIDDYLEDVYVEEAEELEAFVVRQQREQAEIQAQIRRIQESYGWAKPKIHIPDSSKPHWEV